MRSSWLPSSFLFFLLPLACSPSNEPEVLLDGGSASGGSSPRASTHTTESGLGGAGNSGAPTETEDNSYSTQITIEEYDSAFCSVDGVIESTNGGFTGSGYANTENALGSSIEWLVQVRAAGTYTLEFDYANAGEARPANLLLASATSASLAFPSTSSWTNWQSSSTSLELLPGAHRIALSATTGGGLPNINRLTISGAALSPADCADEPSLEGTGGSGEIPQAPLTIWIAGDSTVANGVTPCPSGWGKYFADYFNDQVRVVNRAQGGRSIQTWLYEGSVSTEKESNGECLLTSETYSARWNETLNDMRPGDYLFIQFGINDGDSSCPRHVGGDMYRSYLNYMASAARERGVTPIFMTPTAAIRCSGSSAIGNRGFLVETKAAASEADVALIDINTLSVALYNRAGLCPNSGSYTGDDAVGTFFCDDHTHFAAAGAEQIAGEVAQAVEDQALPLASYLKK